MDQKRICCPVSGGAISFAAAYLHSLGFTVTDDPDPDSAHLLLPVPVTQEIPMLLKQLVPPLPEDILVSGGNLDWASDRYRTVDFLKDPYYLARNAAITAQCAMNIIKSHISGTLNDFPVLVTGWGRISQCLRRLLDKKGADVTIAARKDADRAMAGALGCRGISFEEAMDSSGHYRLIVNTVPHMVLPDIPVRSGCVILELASKPGVSGGNIIDGRRLPGRMAPEESGKLIAETFIRLSLGKEAIP